MSKNSMNFNVNFNSQFDSSQILKGLEEIRKKMGALSANEQIFKGVDKEFLKLKSLLTTLDTQSKNVGNPAGLNLYQRTLEKVRESANKISQEMSSIAKNETKAFQFKDVAEAQKKIQQLNAQIEKANKDLNATSTSVQGQLKGMGITADDKTLSTYIQQLSQGKSLVSVITQELIRQTAEVNKIRQKYEELNKESRNIKISADDQIASKGSYKTKTQAEAATTQTIKTAISTNFANGVKDAAVVLANIQSLLDAQGIKLNENSKVWDNIKNTYTQLVAKQQTLNAQFEPMKSSMTQLANTTSNIVNRGLNDAIPGFQNLQNKLVQDTNEVSNLNGKLQATNDEMNNLNSQNALDTVGKDTEKATIKTEALINAQQSSINAQRDMNSQQQILNQAFDRIGMAVKNVLSLGNAWRQVNRYIRQTFQDVQRLDQAFASIAMVTNYQMSDLWGMYDQYSEIANRLGQTTEGAIKSSALFIQQGLEMSEALSLAEDTLKMATLAGEDYTTATTQMTAAIRGFRMEMDESSRVTDVYSELAANVTVPLKQTYEPQDMVDAVWKGADPSTVPEMSATAFFFARKLNEMLDVPVGIVSCAYGGARIESWTPKEILETYPDEDLSRERIENMVHYHRPYLAYNAMLCPVMGYTVKGFIWYQGCSNVGKHDQFVERMSVMVDHWRSCWSDEKAELPFYMVELAPYRNKPYTAVPYFALLRQAQHEAAKAIPNCGIIVTNDLVESYEQDNIHPAKKKEVGERLAALALNRDYGMWAVPCYSPEAVKCTRFSSCELAVELTDCPNGLNRWMEIEGLEVAGSEGIFYPVTYAYFEWEQKILRVRSEFVHDPCEVRYGWGDFKPGNLKNCEGLPVAPFYLKVE